MNEIVLMKHWLMKKNGKKFENFVDLGFKNVELLTRNENTF